jgi:hypothetical protein
MKIQHSLFILFLLLLVSSCYAGITGKVIDAETQKPIEGAVVLVEWTKTKGMPGMTHTESAKVIEVISDKDGNVEISGNYNPFVNPPHVTVYKKGYVAWNNEYIFPDYKKRTDFKWASGYIIKMAKFNDEYSYIMHQSFIDAAAALSSSTMQKKLFIKAYEEAEQQKVIKERHIRDEKKK